MFESNYPIACVLVRLCLYFFVGPMYICTEPQASKAAVASYIIFSDIKTAKLSNHWGIFCDLNLSTYLTYCVSISVITGIKQ